MGKIMGEKKVQQKQTSYLNMFTGSISGAVSRTLTNPLERLKMLK